MARKATIGFNQDIWRIRPFRKNYRYHQSWLSNQVYPSMWNCSQAVLQERPSSKKYPWPINMRQRLKDDGIFIIKLDHLLFTQDNEFSSPSAAAAVIQGGHANGLIAWKKKDGKTLKELENLETTNLQDG